MTASVSSSGDSPVMKLLKHLVDNVESLLSFALGLLIILFIKDVFKMSAQGTIIGVVALIAVVWSAIELVKQLFGDESAFWKVVSVVALVFSISFAFLALA